MAQTGGVPRIRPASRDIDLNRVAVFVRIAEARGVSAAAARSKQPKSSISRALTQLEDELGVELVDRRARTFQLTEAGKTFYEAASRGLATVEDAREVLRPLSAEPRGTLRIAAPPGFASAIISPAMVAFVQRYPAVDIELSVIAANVDPVRDGYDIVFATGPVADSSAIARKFPALDCGIFASAGYLRERGVPRKPADLAQHECVLQTRTAAKNRWKLVGPAGTREVVVRGRLAVDDVFSAIGAASAGGGLVVLATHVAAREPAAASLQRVLPDHLVPGEPVQILQAPARHVPLRVSMFVSALIATMQTTCTA